MEIQRAVSFLKSLPEIIQQLSVLHKLALLCAFLGSATFGYGLYLNLHQVSAHVPEEVIIGLDAPQEEKIEALPAATPASILVVDVSGAVVQPGVYSLTLGERVSDAVAKAGGFAKKADKNYINKSINLAQVLQDAMKVYIPFEGEVIDAQTKMQNTTTIFEESGTSHFTVNVNTATLAQLDGLKGIGTARAQQILDNRPYIDLADFSAKTGLSQSIVDQLVEFINF